MANPDDVKKITGYTIGGVSPVGHLKKVKIYIDNNLERFKKFLQQQDIQIVFLK
jgi:prolyl-tRNA editing enzyme YbaK/EbsC (Cys-tRNA(Pro) deacylase)